MGGVLDFSRKGGLGGRYRRLNQGARQQRCLHSVGRLATSI